MSLCPAEGRQPNDSKPMRPCNCNSELFLAWNVHKLPTICSQRRGRGRPPLARLTRADCCVRHGKPFQPDVQGPTGLAKGTVAVTKVFPLALSNFSRPPIWRRRSCMPCTPRPAPSRDPTARPDNSDTRMPASTPVPEPSTVSASSRAGPASRIARWIRALVLSE